MDKLRGATDSLYGQDTWEYWAHFTVAPLLIQTFLLDNLSETLLNVPRDQADFPTDGRWQLKKDKITNDVMKPI